jgi:hypothetical protein
MNIPNQIFWLERRAIDNIFDQDEALLFERLLEQDNQLREKCKLQMRKKYAGRVQYSAIIGKDGKEIHLWKMIMNRLQRRRVDARKIRRLMLQTDCPTALQMDIPTATRAQQDCRRRYKLHKENQAALCEAFRLTVSERRALKYGTLVETQQKITRNAFHSKRTFSRIRTVHQKNCWRYGHFG